MTSKTHVAFGLLTGLLIKYNLPIYDTYILLSGVCIGSLIPDLDTKKSDPSQIFPPISKIVDRFTKHRGASHQIFPILFIIAYLIWKKDWLLWFGVGGFSHTFLDISTFKLHIHCGSKWETFLYVLFWVLAAALIFFLATGMKINFAQLKNLLH